MSRGSHLGSDDQNKQRIIGLITNLAKREISAQYKRTLLGRLWSLLNPLASIAIYGLIFGVVFQGSVQPGRSSGIDSFALWIAVGVIAWGFFSNAIISTMNSLMDNQALLTKVYFPRYVLAVSKMIANIINHAPELIVLIVIVAVASGPRVFLFIPVLLVTVLITAVFATGLGLVLSILMVYFRDLQYLWGIVNQVWMYASGVVFPLSMLNSVSANLYNLHGLGLSGRPLPIETVFRLNPAELFLELYRACLFDVALPEWQVLVGAIAWAVLALLIGIIVFRRYQDRIVEEL